MSCNTYLQNAELRLERLGIRVNIYEVWIDRDLGNRDTAKVKISSPAARLIAREMGDYPEPVVVELGDERLCRMALEADNIEIGIDESFLKLTDCAVAFDRGVVSGSWKETTLGEVVEFIFGQRADPNGLVTRYEFTDAELQNKVFAEEKTTAFGVISQAIDEAEDLAVSPLLPIPRLLEEWNIAEFNLISDSFRAVGSLARLKETKATFVYDEITPAQALSDIEQRFGIQTWVTQDGVLRLGFPEVVGNVLPAGVMPGGLRVTEYNVHDRGVPVKGVEVTGAYQAPVRSKYNQTIKDMDLAHRARATYTEASDGRVLSVSAGQVESLKSLGDVAERVLRREIYDGTMGDIKVNVLTSGSDVKPPHEVELGDMVFVVGLPRDCKKQAVHDGVFAVHGIRHRVNPTNGWELTLRVGLLTPEESIDVETQVMNPSTNQWQDTKRYYESLGFTEYDGP
jgi:hypothetical protein